MMLLLRRRWIDVEKVPFPHVLAAYETIRRVKSSTEPSGRGKWFLIGMIIGLILEFQIMFTYLFSWWPDILAWRLDTSPTGCYHPPEGDPLSSIIVAYVGYSKDVLSFAMFYFAPLDVSFTVWVVHLIIVILTQIAYGFGYYTGALNADTATRMKGTADISFNLGPPFYWAYVVGLGGTMGIFIMILWNSRSYLVETLRTALQGRQSEIEKKEAFNYRTIYIMLIFSIILVLLFLFSAGLSLGTALVVLIFGGFVNVISNLYILGITGEAYINNRNLWRAWPLGIIWPNAPSTYTTDYLMSHTFIVTAMNHPSHGMLITGMTAGQGYKLADLTDVSAKHIFYLTVLGSLIAVPTVIATRVWVLNLLGAGRVPIWGECSISDLCGNSIEWVYAGGRASILTQFECMVVGIIITMALFTLKGRFMWWPISPIGFIIAGGYSTLWDGSWDAFLGAWIAKYLTLRIGGSKAYEQYGVSTAGGLVAGITLGSFLAYFVGMAKFFVPF
jgi:hypothetical protein